MEFLGILLPIFLIFGIGYIGQKTIGFDVRNLSTMALYLLSPVLVFRTFYGIELQWTHLYMFLYCMGLFLSLVLLTTLIGRAKGYNTPETCGMILASVFMNGGNYGVPLVLFVFGNEGLDYAVFLMVVQALLMSTMGVYYAAKGSPEGGGVRSALTAVRRVPVAYGVLVGLAFTWLGVPLSEPILQAVDLVANATIPIIMIVLGMQLAQISIRKLKLEKLSYSLSLKMLVSPAIALVITLLLPVEPMLKQIMILIAAMPTAANTTLLALQFQTDADFVSSATLISTSLSVITLPLLMFWLV
ncbi:AEC family transporter [Desmospora activa]|uniref:AEC family transporter n=1 Tax=Desmospora activa DSM 45169 TaxID=1121389 RepID=A0A2T4Z9B8_9BACL|nr:AEC family transporter [Desmospora activa]PTM58486.1 hypothetical protein C8J48_1069 [Desmospora activa DSM 45169]